MKEVIVLQHINIEDPGYIKGYMDGKKISLANRRKKKNQRICR